MNTSPHTSHFSTDNAHSLPGITLSGGFRFRAGQRMFLQKFVAALLAGERNHLGVFVPGYGKTITALASFLVARAMSVTQKLVIFVPRGNLRDQYANPDDLATLMKSLGAPPLTFAVADSEKKFLHHLDTDVVITTYQYASGRAGSVALEAFCRRSLCMFVFDEVHHLSEDGTWAASIKKFPCVCTVALSGTPVRSDNKMLFGVPTDITAEENGKQTQFYKPLHEVLLRDAHAEGGVLKRVRAHVVDYAVTLKHTETGEVLRISLTRLADEATTPADIDTFLARKQLRFHEVYLETLLTPAFEHFAEKRNASLSSLSSPSAQTDKPHQMLIIAMSNRHAAAILEFVQQHFPHYRTARIGQDVAARERKKRLAEFRAGTLDVMVQVDMIGEGTDIKPISVIVKADLVRAFSKTLQQIFRGMRYHAPFGDAGNVCDIYTSNDSEVVSILDWLTSEEQFGVTLHTARKAGSTTYSPPIPRENWHLHNVQEGETASHALEAGDGCMHLRSDVATVVREKEKGRKKHETLFAINHERDAIHQALENTARERELKQECLALVMKLAKILPKDAVPPHASPLTFVQLASLRRFAKSYDAMTAAELVQKRLWLQGCLREKRLLE
jgi:superfamily II DNA or RNA helicase